MYKNLTATLLAVCSLALLLPAAQAQNAAAPALSAPPLKIGFVSSIPYFFGIIASIIWARTGPAASSMSAPSPRRTSTDR